jgi:hypothetical protein
MYESTTGEEGRNQGRKSRKGDQLDQLKRARAVGGGGHSIQLIITVMSSDIPCGQYGRLSSFN